MCNPNSSIANRRYRAVGLSQLNSNTIKSASVITQNLFSSVRNTGSEVESQSTITRSTDFGNIPSPTSSRIVTSSNQSSNNYIIPPTFSFFQNGSLNLHSVPKPKPKRRRKPQKPGKTAKQNDRHFVVHNYHDHANDKDENLPGVEGKEGQRRRGGVAISFPLKLHAVLDQVEMDGLAHIVSWQPHGRSFVIHKPKEFTEHVMPHYFRQTKLTSFQRQLNLYGFARLTRGNDSGGYYHELFLRGKPFLCKRMVRTKVKGTKFKAASSPDQEPDFYSMAPVLVTPSNSDCDNSEDGNINSNQGFIVRNNMVDDGLYEQLQSSFPDDSFRVQNHGQEYYSPAVSYRPVANVPNPQEVNPLPFPSFASSNLVSSPIATANNRPQQRNSDSLDDAVNELFLNDSNQGGMVNDSVLDFVNVWDPSCYGPDAELVNDTQLGNILDRLLED